MTDRADHSAVSEPGAIRLQLALDSPEDLALVRPLARYFDLLEVGTPLLKRFGVGAIATVRELGAGLPVVADTKTVDGGRLEAEMVFAAGAAFMTVIAQAPSATRNHCRAVAAAYDANIVVDTILNGWDDPELLVADCSPTEAWIGLHAPSDGRQVGKTADHITAVTRMRQQGFRVALAGGICRSNLAGVIEARPHIAVIGSGVTKAEEPEREAAWISAQMDASMTGG